MRMIEKIARAIAQVREQNGAAPYDGWDAIHGERRARKLREELFEEARAALQAMRELTPEMTDMHPPFVQKQEFLASYRAMIDAALTST